jgi:hypothetical protein
MVSDASPTAAALPAWQRAIGRIEPPPGLRPQGLADLLAGMPEAVAGLPRRDVRAGSDSATAVYVAGEETGQPTFGMVVALVVPPRDDADAAVAALQRERWGDPAEHTVTASSPGGANGPAFREFWRAFPPGLFALPNQPVYFLLFYRAGSEYAFMIVAATPVIRSELAVALAATIGD